MSTTKRDLSYELYNRLTGSEYSMAAGYLNDACNYADQAIRDDTTAYDNRIRDCLTCAFDIYKSAGEYHAASVIREYMNFF